MKQESSEEQEEGDEMVGRHHWPSGHEFEQTPGDSERQGSLASRSPWGGKESGTTWRPNNEEDRTSSLVHLWGGGDGDPGQSTRDLIYLGRLLLTYRRYYPALGAL